jgi:signal transduction histidine kinase
VLERLSIRWRLALISSALTFLILCGFAVVVGSLTVNKVRSNFSNATANAASQLSQRLRIETLPQSPSQFRIRPDIDLYAASNDAEIRLFNTQRVLVRSTRGSPDFGPPKREGSSEVGGYLVETRLAAAPIGDNPATAVRIPVWIEYARPLDEVQATVRGVRLFLTLGVLGGTLLALAGALALARRSLRPITALTATAQDIARTRDPSRSVPQPRSDDEVADLARTFDEMLGALEASRLETEDALQRQRDFVADASHELRTPLTSVLANLELLTDELGGEEREAAEAALRSSRRMRRLVADLLLLARSDAGHEQTRCPVDLASVALDAVAEAGALSDEHDLGVDAPPGAMVLGVRDDLHRLVLNLLENAIRHTPAGTAIRARVRVEEGEVVLVVEDDGPGVPEELRETIFDRFVRAGRDRATGSTGLGLAIVRAVAVAHGGTVALEDAEPGARFVVRLPQLTATDAAPCEDPEAEPAAAGAGARRSVLTRTLAVRRGARRGAANGD